jgi:dTDP-4-dehydrorhamnose reductase
MAKKESRKSRQDFFIEIVLHDFTIILPTYYKASTRIGIFAGMINILVLGKNGQLGKALENRAKSGAWTFMGRDDLNLEDKKTIYDTLMAQDFDVLINCAAYTAVDDAEIEPKKAKAINSEALKPISRACRKKQALLMHLSTDYVFGETAPFPIDEDHPTKPASIYGQTKFDGEEIVEKHCPRHIIIRTSWLYGSEGHNFLKTMLRLAENNQELNVVLDQVGTPTFVDDLAEAIIKILEKKWDKSSGGIYHYSNEGLASWFDFAKAIFELTGTEMSLHPVDSLSFPTKAKRPAYSVLNKEKIKEAFDIEVPYWRDGLKRCLEKMGLLQQESK